jgi:hypothetical protein
MADFTPQKNMQPPNRRTSGHRRINFKRFGKKKKKRERKKNT